MRTLLVLVALMSWFPPAVASSPFTEIVPGVDYPAGTRLGVTAWGVSFDVPAGWHGLVPVGTQYLLLGSYTEPGVILVTALPGMDMDGLKTWASAPLDIDVGIRLQPDGAPRVEDNQVLASHSGVGNGQALTSRARAVLGSNRTAIAFLWAGPAASPQVGDKVVATLVSSARFGAVDPKVAEATSVDWSQRLRGAMLLRIKVSGTWSSSSSSSESRLYLCSDGTALWGAESSMSVQGYNSNTSSAGQSADRGRYTFTGPVLRITWSDGNVSTYTLTPRKDPREVDLNGETWFIQGNDRCR